MNMTALNWAAGAALLLVLLYKLATWNHNFFSRRGVKCYRRVPIFGSMASIVFRKKSIAQALEEVCNEFPGKRYVGFLRYREPILVVKDPELIKLMTVKDFHHFTDHQQTFSENADPILTKSLSILTGEKWHNMRSILSPAFTSSKMKNMFHLMNECGKQVGDYLQEEINKEKTGKPLTLDMKDLFTRYTNDVIATSAFGIHIDSLKEKDNHFYRMGKQITRIEGIKLFKMFGFMIAPKLMELLGISLFTKKECKFFEDLVQKTISTRVKEGIVRPDMIHLLMEARNAQLTDGGKTVLTDEDIVAQAMIFFFAGFETASVLLSFTSMLLATHEDVQKRLQQEVDEMLGDDLTVTYDKVQKMKYLDMVLSESLRIYPPAAVTDRVCTKSYAIRNDDGVPEYIFSKKEAIWIPVYGMHHNPEYFPSPEKFDPERFNDDNKHNIIPYTYLPFGIGPRICIGQRFALLEAKVALIHILARFNLTVVEKTPLPLRLAKNSITMSIEGGFWLGVTSRKNSPH